MLSTSFFVKIAAAVGLGFVNIPVNFITCEQLFVRSEAVYFPVVQYDDLIGVLDAGNTLGDNQLRRVRDLCGKGMADPGVRRGIHRACGVVEVSTLGFFSKALAMHRRCF